MNFFDVMQNLAVGIAGGIFSSVIVSVVFYLLNEYQNELNKAKDMIYPLYEIVALGMVDEADRVPKDFKMMSIIGEYFIEIENNFSRFEPWQFKYELKEVMCKINEIICDGKYYEKKEQLEKRHCMSF